MPDPSAPATGGDAEPQLMFLTDWALARGLNPDHVRKDWPSRDGFPAHADTVSETGRGRRRKRYDPAKLDDWLRGWREETAPTLFPAPEHPDEFRTFYGIAKLLGLGDKRNISQYRAEIEMRCRWEEQPKRTVYHTGDVVDFLNNSRSHVHGVALDPTRDRRRKPKTGS